MKTYRRLWRILLQCIEHENRCVRSDSSNRQKVLGAVPRNAAMRLLPSASWWWPDARLPELRCCVPRARSWLQNEICISPIRVWARSPVVTSVSKIWPSDGLLQLKQNTIYYKFFKMIQSSQAMINSRRWRLESSPKFLPLFRIDAACCSITFHSIYSLWTLQVFYQIVNSLEKTASD
jgi:hypothetical protein